MVCLFDKTATTFEGNGICVLSPSVCTVHEIGGGSYELHMEHPMDDIGKWKMIGDDSLIKAPVPPNHIPQITLPAVKIWQTSRQTNLYSKLPVAAKRESKESKETLSRIKNNTSAYAYGGNRFYNIGEYVVNGAWIYRAVKGSANVSPGSDNSVWTPICKTNDVTPSGSSGGEYDPGKVAETLSANETVYKIADYNATYIQVRSLRGKVGYVAKADCVETQTTSSGEVIPAQNITEQVFRVYSIECEDDTQQIIVDAKHISYDFQGNSLYDCQFKEADPGTAVAALTGALMIEDDRKIACDITGKTISKDWSFKNPINALLDPSDGFVSALNAKLIRNNGNFFILDGTQQQSGITISYGVNMLGVRWTRSTENVITRIIPRCNAGDGGYLYLEDLFVDSDVISEYPFPKILVLTESFKVGEEYEKPDGTKAKRTEENCRQQMLEDAQKKYSEDHVDSVELTLEVEFVLLGDTEEYKQYKGLQRVNLYDTVTINTGKSNIKATARVTEYEWDCLLGRYNNIVLGTVSSFNKRIPGYRVTNQSITYDKLSPELFQRIVSSNDSASSDSGSGGQSESGSGTPISASVTDGNPTLNWNTRSTVGTINGTDLHVTMPVQPAYPNRAPLENGTNESIVTDGEKYVWTYREGFTLINTTTDADTLTTPDEFTRRWRGDNVSQLTHGPVNENIPWALESFILGSNIHYQRQICYIYSETGILRYERQGIYTGTGSTGFGWTAWASDEVAIDALNSQNNSTNDILADALACTGSMFFKGSGSNYTGNVPTNNFKYGIFIVNVRGSNVRFVIAQDQGGSIATNAYDGSNWSGWEIIAQKDELDTLSSKMNIPASSGTYATLSALETYLTSVFNSLSVGETKNLHIITGSSFDNSVFNKGERYVGTLAKYTTDQFVCELASRLGDSVQIGYYNGTYTVSNIANKVDKFPYGSIINTACTVVNRGNHFVGFVALPTIVGIANYTITFATGAGHENALQSVADIDISTISITNRYRTGFIVDIPYTSSVTGTVFKTSFSIS